MKRRMISTTLAMATGWFMLGEGLLGGAWKETHASQQRVATQKAKKESGLMLYKWGRKHLQERLQRQTTWQGRRAVALFGGGSLEKPQALKHAKTSSKHRLKLALPAWAQKTLSPQSKSLRPQIDLSTIAPQSDAYLPSFGYGVCLSFDSKNPQAGWCEQPLSLVQQPLSTVPHKTMMQWERLITPFKLLW